MKTTIILIFCVMISSFHLSEAGATTSAEVITRAKAYAYHPWHCSSANTTASCVNNYISDFVVGDHLGLPYDWGGYMSLYTFDIGIEEGLAAGSYWYHSDGNLPCTVGLDCSGFVSQCWHVGHHTTGNLPDISRVVPINDVKRGDAFNRRDDVIRHVILYSHRQPDGRPFLYESAGYNVHATYYAGWSYLDGYTPLRYLDNSDDEDEVPIGTGDNPIEIDSYHFVDTNNTVGAYSDEYDRCAAAAGTRESGPEVVYRLRLDTPGRLTISVQDGTGVDIDIHVYTDLNYGDCFARHDNLIDINVDCGEYFIVADTYADSIEHPGAYDLTVDFVPSGTQCGAPDGYEYTGEIGSRCGFPANPTPNLPFCNPNLGAVVCIYTGENPGDLSFCSLDCTRDSDCTANFEGGCCADFGDGDFFCVTSDFCEPVTPDEDRAEPDSLPDQLPDTLDSVETGEPPPDEPVPDEPDLPFDVEPDTFEPPDSFGETSTIDTSTLDTSTIADTYLVDSHAETAADSGVVTSESSGGGDGGCGCAVRSASRGGLVTLLAGLALLFWLPRLRFRNTSKRLSRSGDGA